MGGGGGGLVEGFWEGQGGGGGRHGVLPSSAAGGACWQIAIHCPSLGPFPPIGRGAHQPLSTLCPSSSSLPYPSLSTSLSFPLAFPSIGHGAHRPVTTLCPSSSSLPNLSLSTLLSFPLVGWPTNPRTFPVSLLCVRGSGRGFGGGGGAGRVGWGGGGSWLLLHIIVLHFGPNTNSDPSPNGYLDPRTLAHWATASSKEVGAKTRQQGPLGAKKKTFCINDRRPHGMPKQVFLARLEPVVACFGPLKPPKYLGNGLFCDQKWVKNVVFQK